MSVSLTGVNHHHLHWFDVDCEIRTAFYFFMSSGGYRDALKFRPGEPITFDPEAFVHSRPSQSTQAFLEGMLTLQIFQQVGFNLIVHVRTVLPGPDVVCDMRKRLKLKKREMVNGMLFVHCNCYRCQPHNAFCCQIPWFSVYILCGLSESLT